MSRIILASQEGRALIYFRFPAGPARSSRVEQLFIEGTFTGVYHDACFLFCIVLFFCHEEVGCKQHPAQFVFKENLNKVKMQREAGTN